ncbi:MAG: hypothetical protein LBH15_00425 [Treponema sp.]|jgi:hypothetical protein|nr:hypothetical protein [Treponema sp.]
MIFLFAFTAVLVIDLTAEHKRSDPAARRLSGIVIRSRQWRNGKKWLSFVATTAGVLVRRSNEIKNTPRPCPARSSNNGASTAVKANIPIVASTRYAVIAHRGHFFPEDQSMEVF